VESEMTDKKVEINKLVNKMKKRLKYYNAHPSKRILTCMKRFADINYIRIKILDLQAAKFPSGGFVSELEEPDGIPARLSPERVIMYKPTERVSEIINNMTYKVIK
jgi:hypothetical protein